MIQIFGAAALFAAFLVWACMLVGSASEPRDGDDP